MKRFGKHFWANLYDFHQRLIGSTPYDSISEAREFLNRFVWATNTFGKGTYKRDGNSDKFIDDRGRVATIEESGDWRRHFDMEFCSIMANYDMFDNVSAGAIHMMQDDAFKALDGEVEGLKEHIENLVRSGRYVCYVSLSKNRMP